MLGAQQLLLRPWGENGRQRLRGSLTKQMRLLLLWRSLLLGWPLEELLVICWNDMREKVNIPVMRTMVEAMLKVGVAGEF